jgi:predicted transcriptional regulator
MVHNGTSIIVGDSDGSAATSERSGGRSGTDTHHGERVKLTVTLSEDIMNALRSLAQERDISMTQALRQAITTERFLADAIKQGEKVLLRDERAKTTREVVFR